MIGLGLGLDRGGFVPKPFLPTDLANLEAWYKADAGIITVSGAVSVWANQAPSGSAKDVTQGTAENRPAYGSTQLNGIDVLSFDGGHFLRNTTPSEWKFLTDASDYTVIIVGRAGKSSNPNAAHAFCGTQVVSPFVYSIFLYDDRSSVSRNNQIAHELTTGGGALVVLNRLNDTFLPNEWNHFSFRTDPDNATASERSIINVNGGADLKNSAATGTPSTSNPSGDFEIGRVSVLPLVGDIAEIIMYARQLSLGELTQVNNYITSKWAL